MALHRGDLPVAAGAARQRDRDRPGGAQRGVKAAFSPNPTTGTSVLTLTAEDTATTGTDTLTISGISGTLTNATTLSLTVNAAPTVTVSPTSLAFAKTVVGATSAKKPVTLTKYITPSEIINLLSSATYIGSCTFPRRFSAP